ncbi:replicative DNA helicase [Paenimyroides ummariense]|uniref:DNA 5'-3' helicase n=1 Tax=Paenimyroides ummariense TaxID=913024 RepID=A0A1I5E1P2_9FLAO|nr:replicative DNA helicase [Paenimyroides ummariense]SFO05398.1 replicative DNA helicase [Paenimyroides ummariense]
MSDLKKGLIPPQAVDIEEAVLGAVLVDNASVIDLLHVIKTPDVFYKPAHQMVFEAIARLSNKNIPVDILSVSNELRAMKKLEEAGGDFYLINLTQKIASAAHIDYHAHILKQYYIKRKIIGLSSEAIRLAYDDAVDSLELMDLIDNDFVKLHEEVASGKTDVSWRETLQQVARNVEMLTNAGENDLIGIETGFTKLNKMFGGWKGGEFIVIGARPGMGKTAFVGSSMISAARAGHGVGFISLEMSAVQLATRAVALNSSLHLKQLTLNGFEHNKYFETLHRVTSEMFDYNIHIDDRPALNINEIKRKARLLHRKHGIKLLIVDYIQLSAGAGKDIRTETGKVTQGLKALAKELDIAVIGLAQLSREVEKTPTKRPALHHLKESGDIEQDADIVAFLYRAEYYGLNIDEELIGPGENSEFIVAKNRSGGLGTVGLWYDANRTKYMDYDPLSGMNENKFTNVHVDQPYVYPPVQPNENVDGSIF